MYTLSPLLVEPMDYTVLSEVLMFAACERRQCVNIIIQDDGVPEQLESFFVTLERTTGLDSRITLDPVDAEIEILDSNSMFVHLMFVLFQNLPVQWLWWVWREHSTRSQRMWVW